MTEAVNGIEKSIRASITAANAAERVVQADSRKILQKLLSDQSGDSADEEIRDLTENDRAKFGSVLRSRARSRGRRSWNGMPFGRIAIIIAVAVLIMSSALTIAHHNTGIALATFSDSWKVRWQLPDGRSFEGHLKPNSPVTVARLSGGIATLRIWVRGVGYAITNVSVDWLLRNAATSPPLPNTFPKL